MLELEFNYPKTSEADFIDWKKDVEELYESSDSGIPSEFMINKLRKTYSEKIFEDDCYVFSDEDEFRTFMEELGSANPEYSGQFNMDTEKLVSRCREAKNELNEIPYFCVWLLDDGKGEISIRAYIGHDISQFI